VSSWWGHAGGAVDAHVGDLIEPAPNMAVRHTDVELQAAGFQARGQRDNEAALEVGVEPLDLAFGLCSVRPAEPRRKAAALGELVHLLVPAVQSGALGVTFDHHGLGVVEQHVLRHATEVIEGLTQPCTHRTGVLGIAEGDVACPAVAQSGHQSQ